MVGCEVLTSGPPGPLPMPSDDALIVTKSQHATEIPKMVSEIPKMVSEIPNGIWAGYAVPTS